MRRLRAQRWAAGLPREMPPGGRRPLGGRRSRWRAPTAPARQGSHLRHGGPVGPADRVPGRPGGHRRCGQTGLVRSAADKRRDFRKFQPAPPATVPVRTANGVSATRTLAGLPAGDPQRHGPRARPHLMPSDGTTHTLTLAPRPPPRRGPRRERERHASAGLPPPVEWSSAVTDAPRRPAPLALGAAFPAPRCPSGRPTRSQPTLDGRRRAFHDLMCPDG